MKRSPSFLFLLTVCIILFPLNSSSQNTPFKSIYAIEHVNVIPMDKERVLADQTVIIKGDRIVQVGPAGDVDIPEGAERIDGNGKYLLPGLAEMHGHIPPPDLPDSYPSTYIEDVLFLYLAGGITTVRGMLGHEGQLELKRKVREGELWGPSLYLAGPSFNGNSISSPEQAEQRVRQQKEEGWDLLKVHPGLTREEFDAMARTANEVGIPFGGHIPEEVGLMHALEMGIQTIEHLDGYIAFMDASDKPLDQAKLEEAVRKTKEAGAWAVPTMALWESLIGAADYDKMRQYPELKYMPEAVLNQWNRALSQFQEEGERRGEEARLHAQNRIILLKVLLDGGVPILMGTDAPQIYSVPGFSIHRELAIMKESGMSNFDILKTGTVNVGKYFKDKDTFGMIAEGHRADLLLLDGNPLLDLGHLKDYSGVMAQGRWLPKKEIDRRLKRIASLSP